MAEDLFVRWECDSDTCPGIPAWDKALTDVVEGLIEEADEAMAEVFRDLAWKRFMGFIEQHPEAVLREPATA